MEYILILLIVVMIALGVLYQFNTAFSNFAQNYFGEYLSCLLETGELPNLGASNGTNCDSQYEEFSIENGRPKSIDPVPIAAVEGDPGRSINTGPVSVAQGRRSARGRPSRQRTSGPSRLGGGKAAKEKQDSSSAKKKTELTAPNPRIRSFSNSRAGPTKIEARGISSVEVAKKKDEKVTEKKSAEIEGDSSGRDEKLRVKKKEKKVVLEEDEPMTFTKFIKYLLIIGIIIAIVVFIGGQFLQFTKDSE